MSYILEALKKAQAERQLGNAPTIHAPTINPAPQAAGGRKPLVIGFAAGAVLVAGALLVWRHQSPTAVEAAYKGTVGEQHKALDQPGAPVNSSPSVQIARPPGTHAPAIAGGESKATQDGLGPQVSSVQGRGSGAPVRPRVEPALDRPAPPSPPPPVEVSAPTEVRTVSDDGVTHWVYSSAERAAPAPTARQSAAPSASPSDETLRTVNDLPEQIRFSVPKVAFGGYMYSPNPADRLVLVDKALRHEGEEVAPGLVLEKLLPKAAVMNFRGYRYRVPL